MKYEKPEVVKLTDALSAIQGMVVKGPHVLTESGASPYFRTINAYEADE